MEFKTAKTTVSSRPTSKKYSKRRRKSKVRAEESGKTWR